MAAPTEPIKSNCDPRRSHDMGLIIPDPHLPEVCRRIAEQSARLVSAAEADARRWIEAVSEFDAGFGEETA